MAEPTPSNQPIDMARPTPSLDLPPVDHDGEFSKLHVFEFLANYEAQAPERREEPMLGMSPSSAGPGIVDVTSNGWSDVTARGQRCPWMARIDSAESYKTAKTVVTAVCSSQTSDTTYSGAQHGDFSGDGSYHTGADRSGVPDSHLIPDSHLMPAYVGQGTMPEASSHVLVAAAGAQHTYPYYASTTSSTAAPVLWNDVHPDAEIDVFFPSSQGNQTDHVTTQVQPQQGLEEDRFDQQQLESFEGENDPTWTFMPWAERTAPADVWQQTLTALTAPEQAIGLAPSALQTRTAMMTTRPPPPSASGRAGVASAHPIPPTITITAPKPAKTPAARSFPCSYPGCPRKPFSRRHDLNRHVGDMHRDPNTAPPHQDHQWYPCDYPRCTRSADGQRERPAGRNGPFKRRDRLREHYRERHKEDLTRRGRAGGGGGGGGSGGSGGSGTISGSQNNDGDEGGGSGGTENAAWWATRVVPLVGGEWWRCSHCLDMRVSVRASGWLCPKCKGACEPERVRRRALGGGGWVAGRR